MQLIKFWREILILGSWGAFGLFYATADSRCPDPTTMTPISVPVSKEEEIKTKTTKTTVKPGGETVTEVTESEKVSKEKSKAVAATTGKQGPDYRYSLGVYVNPVDYKNVTIDAGARLGNLPLEAVGGYNFTHKEFHVGLRLNF